MGCGVSTSSSPPAGTLEKHLSDNRRRDRQEHARKLMKVESKLGSKKIVNSFVVASAKAKARKRASFNGDQAGTRTEPGALNLIKETFELPAENANVAEPDMLGIAASGPSFKMARGRTKSSADLHGRPDEEARRALATVAAFKHKLYGDDDEGIMEATMFFREQLSVSHASVGEVRMMGVVPRLVELLGRESSLIQHEAAWALTNICSAHHADCQDAVDQGAVPALVRLLLKSKDVEVLQQVIWALGNIAADSDDMQQTVLDEGALDPVLRCIQGRLVVEVEETTAGEEEQAGTPVKLALIRQAAWLLSNMCRPRPQDALLYNALPVLEKIIESITDSEALTHMCWTLAYMSSAEEGPDKLAASPFIMKQLATWISEPTLAMSAPSLRTVGNICSGSASCTQAVTDAEGIQAILSCMTKSAFLSVRKECIWSLSNLAVGSSKRVQLLADAGAFRAVIQVMRESGGDEGVMGEASYVLANPWSSSIGADALAALIEQGVVHEMVNLLAPETSEKILKVVMDGLKDAVKKGVALGIGAADNLVENPVVKIMRTLDTRGRLQRISADTREMEVASMANALINAISHEE